MLGAEWTGVFVSVRHRTHPLNASRAGRAIDHAKRSYGAPRVVGRDAQIVGCAISKTIDR